MVLKPCATHGFIVHGLGGPCTTHGFIVHGLGGPYRWFYNHAQGLLNNPWFYCTWFRKALQMVLRPCARPPKQPMVL